MILYFVNRGKVFFRQERPGKAGKIFSVIKFKTMRDDRDTTGNLLPDEKRLSGIGKLIRKTSLDELPQLLNVIAGHMSLVGPRPLLKEYLPLYNDVQRRRHEVKPGITGWAQVNGRNTVSWPQKFAYDVWYVDHVSFWLDIKILLLTVMKVFKAEGSAALHQLQWKNFMATTKVLLQGGGGHAKVVPDVLLTKVCGTRSADPNLTEIVWGSPNEK